MLEGDYPMNELEDASLNARVKYIKMSIQFHKNKLKNLKDSKDYVEVRACMSHIENLEDQLKNLEK